jgi:hypothetical protein
MPIDFPSSPTTGQVYTYAGVTYVFSAQGVWTTAGASAVGIIGGSPQGRLTLQSLIPVMTTTQAAKTTIYYTPYVGDRIPIYDGTSMVMAGFTELSVATTDTTKSPAAIGVSKVNDWFVWLDGATVRLGHGPDWTSDILRSAGTALVKVNGIWLNNASITNGPAAQRGTFVGTTCSNASSQLDWIYGAIALNGTAGFFGVWNAYNRIEVASVTGDSTGSWSYALTTIRAANASATMRCSFVCGLDENPVTARYQGSYTNSASAIGVIGVGFDSTTALSQVPSGFVPPVAQNWTGQGFYGGNSGIGFHFISANEKCNTANSITFYGQSLTVPAQNGLFVELTM